MSVVFEFNCAVCFIVHLAFMLSLSHHHKHYHLTLALLSPFLCIVIIIVHVLFSGLAVTCRLRRLINWHFTLHTLHNCSSTAPITPKCPTAHYKQVMTQTHERKKCAYKCHLYVPY